MSQGMRPVYLVAGVANFNPPPMWEEARAGGGKSLQQYWETGKLQQIYAESFLEPPGGLAPKEHGEDAPKLRERRWKRRYGREVRREGRWRGSERVRKARLRGC